MNTLDAHCWPLFAAPSIMFDRGGELGIDHMADASPHFTVQKIEKCTVVEFKTPSLMDAGMLTSIGESIYKLIDEQDQRVLVLDFERVQYLSSQAIGIVLTCNKKLSQLK